VEDQMKKQQLARDQTIGALNELSSVIVNLAAVRYLLEQVEGS